MANVNDVVAYILKKTGSITSMKMQKLAYYSQAWHLVWEEQTLFDSEIQAWANGPVIYQIYSQHRGQFLIDSWPTGDASNLSATERTSVDAVLAAYGRFTAHQLSEMTHSEEPWINARKGLPEGSRSSVTISPASMHEFYHGLAQPRN